jgi:hypothetical protein
VLSQREQSFLAIAQDLQTNNPGWPGFVSGGWLSGAALYVAIAL